MLSTPILSKPMPPGGGRTADLPVNVLLLIQTDRWRPYNKDKYPRPLDIVMDRNKNFYLHHSFSFIKKDYDDNILVEYPPFHGSYNHHTEKIASDSHNNIYSLDAAGYGISVIKYDSLGNELAYYDNANYNFAKNTNTDSEDIWVDKDDNVYVLVKHRLTKISPTGVKLIQKDLSVDPYSFPNWHEVLTDSQGNIYVADHGADLIRKYDKDMNLLLEKRLDLQGLADDKSFDIDSNDNIYILSGFWLGRVDLITKIDTDLNITFQKKINPGDIPNLNDSIYRIAIDKTDDSIYALIRGIKIQYQIVKLDETFSNIVENVRPPTYSEVNSIFELTKKIVSTPKFTQKAHFGLFGYSNIGYKIVDLDVDGATNIYNLLNKPYVDLDLTTSWFGYNVTDGIRKSTEYLTSLPQNLCQRTILINISDRMTVGGYTFDWPEHAGGDTTLLYNDYDIKSYVVDLNVIPNNTDPNENHRDSAWRLATRGGTAPAPGAFYGYDYRDSNKYYTYIADDLYKYIFDTITGNIELRYTFTNPVIITNELGEEHIYHAVFDYQSDGQWQGRLRKFKAEVDGGVGALEWDAGEVLDATPPDSRKIWTKSNSLPNSYNNFSVANVNNLKTLLGYSSNSSATSFIRFVRGYDSYDENQNGSTIDSRWKLGDIYHSQLVLQEAPNGFISLDEGHFEGYYRHTHNYQDFINAHKNRNSTVFVGANDGMLHAFSAQSGEELWGFVPPNIINTIKEMDESGIASNSSESIFAVDGRIALKDIYTGGRWKSVLMVGLGQGGKGYFALDVTDETAPKFMFAFLNDVDDEKVYYWNNSGAKTEYTYASVPAQFDYSKLGLATSKPHIINIKQGSSRKWVAIVGGGENDGVRNTYAQGLLVLDLENDGKVLENISLTDRTNDIINAVPNQLTLISGDTTNVANYKGYMGYITDYEGKTWKLDLTDNGTMFETTILHDVEATKTNGRYGSNKLTPSISKELNLWNYFGTGDKVNIESPSQNKILGLKDDEFPIFNIAEIPNASLKNAAIGCPATSEKGWYWDLGDDAKVTGKVAIVEGLVYVPVYTPDPSSECRTGYASIRIYDMSCGELIDDIDVVRGVPGDIIAHKDKLYMSVSKREEKGELPIKNSDGDEIGEVEENIAVIQAITSNNKKLQIKNWKEVR
jgi:hypothetical protein